MSSLCEAMTLRYDETGARSMVAIMDARPATVDERRSLLDRRPSSRRKHREMRAKNRLGGSCITLLVASLPLLLLPLLLVDSGIVLSASATVTSMRLVESSNEQSSTPTSDSRSQETQMKAIDDENGNQSAHQSDDPEAVGAAAAIIGQQSLAPPPVELTSVETHLSSSSSSSPLPAEEQTTATTIELYPSQFREESKIATTETDRRFAFNKCNSSDRSGRRQKEPLVDKQAVRSMVDDEAAAADSDNRRIKRIRRHMDVGHRGRSPFVASSVVSRMFVGHHQTSLSFAHSSPASLPSEVELFSSWPQASQPPPPQQQHDQLSLQSQSQSRSIGREIKRKRPSLEEAEPPRLAGSVGGPSRRHPHRTSVARGPADAGATEEEEGEADGDDDEDDDDDDGRADSFATKASERPTSRVGRHNSGRHIRADAAIDDISSAELDAGRANIRRFDTTTVGNSARSGQAVNQGPDRLLADIVRAGKDYRHGGSQGRRVTDRRRRQRDQHGREPARHHGPDQVGGSEDEGDDGGGGDQIISHYNLIELMDDDLFLAKESLPSNSTASLHSQSGQLHDVVRSERHFRLARSGGVGSSSSSSLVLNKMRTIYFGGFFPWLEDEDTRLGENGAAAAAASSSAHAGNNNNDDKRLQQQSVRNKSSGGSLERRRANNEAPDSSSSSHELKAQGEQRPWMKTSQSKQQQQQLRTEKQYETDDDESAKATAAAAATASPPAAPVSFPQNGLGLATSSQQGSASSFIANNNNNNNNNNINNRHQLGRFILPAVRLALDHINTNNSILGTYKLEIVPRDTQCNATISLKEFFDMVYEEPKKMLLYGDACRVSTDPIAKASYFFDLIQISYADTDPIYTIENYPNFFRVVPSENALSLARIPFIRHFNWTRVGTIYQNLPRYSLRQPIGAAICRQDLGLTTDLERKQRAIRHELLRYLVKQMQVASLQHPSAAQNHILRPIKLFVLQTGAAFLLNKYKLLTDLERFKIVIKQSVSLPGSIDGLQNRDLGDELRKLKEKDVRIILGNFDEEWALLLFCEAYREKMTGRKYQWILTGVSEDKLWQHYLKKGSECSEQELLIAMDGYIITDITPVTRAQHRTISGMMAHEYSNEYRRRAHEMNIAIEENKFYGYVYDGIWAIALALHRVDSQLRYYNRLFESGKAKLNPDLKGITSLLDFDYHKPIWVKLIRNALNKTRFNGVTGTVSFHKNERPGLISFSQFQAFRDMNEVIIGSYDALNDELDLKVGFPIFWRGSSPPIDYTIERVTPFRINRTLFVIISIMALFGIVLATVFLTINIKYRNQRYIKMSSPYLNNLIIIGCILTYTSVIILGLDSGLTSEFNFPYICNARAWVLMAGFTLAFGSMFSKTFRVHSIFTNIKLHKKVIKDYKLFMVVFILLTFDVCILIVWQYFDPFYRETNNGTSIQDPDNEDIIIVPEMEHCQSKRMTIFLSVIYVYKGLLMAFGCFLAWETRHVSIPALNDSKYIGLSVYNVVIMCVIGAGLSFVLRDQQDASFVIISIFIIFCSTTTLCLVFVPKLIELKQNPKAGDHRVRATLKTFKKNYHEEAFGAASCRDIHGNIIGRGYGINLNERIKIMLDENTKQRSNLKEKTYELEALTYKYRKIQGMIQSGQYLQALTSTGSNPKQLSGQSMISDELSPRSAATLLTTNHQNQSTSSTSRLSPVIVTQTSDLTAPPEAAARGGKLQKTLVSGITQITTATTTTTTTNSSSTNNATEFTNDYSSTKPTSRVNAADGAISQHAKQTTSVAFEGSPCGLDKTSRVRTEPREAIEAPGRGQRSSILVDSSKKRTMMGTKPLMSDKTMTTVKQNSPKYTTDSSYCSMGADYELSDVRKSSQDNLNLFNVLSFIEDGTNSSNTIADKTRQSGNSNEMKLSRGQYVESKFNLWSAGPFCTLMVRNKPEQQAKENNIAMTRSISPIERLPVDTNNNNNIDGRETSGRKISEEIRASCPDIAASVATKSTVDPARLPSPTSYQQKMVESTTTAAEAAGVNKRSRLPRTISMIEYLGLSDFDFIAKRHDKLVKRKLQFGKRRQLDYCCVDESNHCSCCYQSGDANNRQSDVDLAFSSGNFANSGDLARTSSHISCSTCCSLMSPSYGSHSDYMFDEVSHSSGSVSTDQTSSSTNANESGSLSPGHCHSNNSKSSTPSSTFENKESSIVNAATTYLPVYQESRSICDRQQASCSHHKQMAYTKHEQTTGGHSPSCMHAGCPRIPVAQTTGEQQSLLCTSGVLYGPASRDNTNCSGRVCPKKLARADSKALLKSSTSSNLLEDLAAVDLDQELQESSIIKCDILESL